MNLLEAQAKIENEFLIQWNDRTPVELQNKAYKPVTGTPWVRLSVVESGTSEPELGRHVSHTRKRHFGFTYIEVFRPAFKQNESATLVTDAENTLQFKTVEKEITFDASSIRTFGEISGGAWYLQMVTIPFRFDEIIQNGN